jgi:transposase-like protein
MTNCIFCGHPVILGNIQKYSGGFFRQTFICRSCGRQYVDGPAFTDKPGDRRINPMERPPCPRCGCEDTMFNEWLETKTRVKPRFRCHGCGRSFTVGGKVNTHKKYD